MDQQTLTSCTDALAHGDANETKAWDRIQVFEREMGITLQSRIRRRRSLISARGWSAATTLGIQIQCSDEPWKGFAASGTLSGLFRILFTFTPALSLRSNAGLELANAFGVLYLLTMRYSVAQLRSQIDLKTCRGSSS